MTLHQESSEDSGIVSFRDEEHTTLTDNLTVQINLDPTTEETETEEKQSIKEPSPRYEM